MFTIADGRQRRRPIREWPPTTDAVVNRLARRGMSDADRERRQWEKLEQWNAYPASFKMQKCASVCRKWGWSLDYIPDFGIQTTIRYKAIL